jgi:chromate transporter
MDNHTEHQAPQGVAFNDALKFWAKLGFISFGGPAGQIAIMHQEVVERRRWVGENQFLRALNFCMLLPGPEAQQLATYIGWRMNGTFGGIAAGTLFVIPSIFVMLLLSYLAVWFGHKVILPGGNIDLFALAVVALVLLQKYRFPVQYLVPMGAVVGVLWRA